MAYNKETNERMEAAAKEAFNQLKIDISKMDEAEKAGAQRVIDYFRGNYMQAGYKKLARKLVKNDPEA